MCRRLIKRSTIIIVCARATSLPAVSRKTELIGNVVRRPRYSVFNFRDTRVYDRRGFVDFPTARGVDRITSVGEVPGESESERV